MPRPVRVIVVANEKGGSGKSTVAIHAAVALLDRGQRVAAIDLDIRQRTFAHYIKNRHVWAGRIGRDLVTPELLQLGASEQDAAAKELLDVLAGPASTYDYVVIDTPGHDTPLMRLAHTAADVLITPLNDSFVDLDVLGSFDADTLTVHDISHYARTVEEARIQRVQAGQIPTDWIVLRNRLSMTPSHNKRLVGTALEALSLRLGFRCVDGLAERVVFREFYLRGLTALDDLDEAALGKRPTLSHATARQEVCNLLAGMNLGGIERTSSEKSGRAAA
jgi:chromosome partitioning protein